MAHYPCDGHGARYTGPQRTAYPAIVGGAMTLRDRRRLCRPCYEELETWCGEYLGLVGSDGGTEPGNCASCNGEAPWAVFVTLYPGGEERKDYYGRCCADCARGDVGQALFGAQGLPEASARP